MEQAILQITASNETSNYRMKAIALLSFLVMKVKDNNPLIELTSLEISKELQVTNESMQRAIRLLEDLQLIRRKQLGKGNRKLFIILELENIFGKHE